MSAPSVLQVAEVNSITLNFHFLKRALPLCAPQWMAAQPSADITTSPASVRTQFCTVLRFKNRRKYDF